jgi:hypothetical protein
VNKMCANCRWLRRIEDDHDDGGSNHRGRRVLLECGRYLPHLMGGNSEDRRRVPLMLTVVERASNPSMSEDDCYAQAFAFGCNFWERRESACECLIAEVKWAERHPDAVCRPENWREETE